MNLELNAKRALVTGGASGIGAAVAARLVDEGARVLIADRDIDAGTARAELLGPSARFVQLDIAADSDWERAGNVVQEWLGGLDILVNCAGIAHHAPTAEESIDDYRRVVEINQFGTFRGIKAASALMSGGGSVVNIASISTLRGLQDSISYAASKAAVLAMTNCAAHDLAARGIRVNAVSPGIVATAMSSKRADTDLSAAVDTALAVPGRAADADDIATVVTFLASPMSSYMTGVDVLVDGGVTLFGAGASRARDV